MTKILQINSHYKKGGAGKIVSYIHEGLLNSGFDSVVVYGRDSLINEENIYKIGTSFTNKIDALLTRIFGKPGFYSKRMTRKIIRRIKEENPDLIHLHGLHGYYLNYEILFSFLAKANIPCVWTFHDCLAFTAKCGYPYECKNYLKGCHSCQRLADYPKTLFFDRTRWLWKRKKELFSSINRMIIVSPSDWMTGLAKSSFFGEKYKCVTINNGIDTDLTFIYRKQSECREKLNLPLNKKIVLAVAYNQDDPRKGFKYIIDAAKELQDYYFVIIGCNEDLSLSLKNVKTLQFTNNQTQLAEYYSSADVFLLPSLAENYATTAIESLACGTPVVGFNVGGIPEQAYGIYGKTVEVGDKTKFISAISEVIDSSNEETKLIISSYIRKRNSISNMLDRYIKLYLELLEQKNKK